jgi:flagellar motor switch protein FliG
MDFWYPLQKQFSFFWKKIKSCLQHWETLLLCATLISAVLLLKIVFSNTVSHHSKNHLGKMSIRMDMEETIENHYAHKIQSLLDQVLGKNNSIVRVDASMHADKIEETQKIMVSVFLKQKINNETGIPEPRSADAMNAFLEIVKNIAGVNEQRGDRVVIKEIVFDEKKDTDETTHLNTGISLLIQLFFISVVLGGFWIFWNRHWQGSTKTVEQNDPQEENRVQETLPMLDTQHTDPLQTFKDLDISQIFYFLHAEKPQTLALIIAHLESTQAAQWIDMLPAEQQSEVLLRLASMNKIDPTMMLPVEVLLRKYLALAPTHRWKSVGGVPTVVKILKRVDCKVRKKIIAKIEMEHAELAEAIKKQMFTFEDMIRMEAPSLQKVLKEIQLSELAILLKSSSQDFKVKILSQLSKQAVALIDEEIVYGGPLRLKDVEEVRQHIANLIRRLEESGEIFILGSEKEKQM